MEVEGVPATVDRRIGEIAVDVAASRVVVMHHEFLASTLGEGSESVWAHPEAAEQRRSSCATSDGCEDAGPIDVVDGLRWPRGHDLSEASLEGSKRRHDAAPFAMTVPHLGPTRSPRGSPGAAPGL